jgi:hypothetical protein
MSYEDNEHYTIAVFDDYKMAIDFILNKGFEQCSTHNLFQRGKKYLIWDKESITINVIKLNVELNYFGEILEEDEKA